jgi:hypothetical protein
MSARIRILCMTATSAVLLLAARPAVAQFVCPLPTGSLPWCDALQTSQCQTTQPGSSVCLPKLVFNIPGGDPVIAECECADGDSCGPVDILPGNNPGEWLYRCIGPCPNPGELCQVFVDGNPTGSPAASSLSFPPDAMITCDCPTQEEEEACCVQLSCFTTTPSDCLANGGTPQGPGTNCTGTLEACCLPDDTCVDVDPICCDDLGGTLQGPGSACLGDSDGDGKDDLCAPPNPEFCPLATDLCANFQFTDCVTTNSVNSHCWPRAIAGADVFPEVLACDCFEDECGPIEVIADPTGTGFNYICPGPCPNPTQPCQVFFDDGSGAVPSGMTSVNSSDVPPGVILTCDCPDEPEDEGCCLPDGTCVNIPAPACLQLMGTPQGPGTACTGIIEACCLPDDTCVDVDRLCCDDLGGTPQGAGSACLGDSDGDGKDDLCSPPITACPLSSDNLCANLQFSDCVNGAATELCRPNFILITQSGGVPAVLAESCVCDDGETCGPVDVDPIGTPPQDYTFSCTGACPAGQPGICQVFVDGVASGATSVMASSLPVNAAVTCDCADEPEEACCLQDGTCIQTTVAGCLAAGGTPQGAGSVCSPNKEACCLPDDTCVDVDPLCCDDLGGVPQGAGSVCLGDSDGDGKDDLCAPPPPECPLTSDQLCANLQATDCADGDATEVCAPLQVIVSAAAGVFAEVCDCVDFSSCGPVHVDPIGSPPTDFAFSCTGACPPGQPGPCLVFVDGVSTGAASINASALPNGGSVTCDCEQDVPECPLSVDQLCANLQATDCANGDPDDVCTPNSVTVTQGPVGPEVRADACECADFTSCGPIQVDPIGLPPIDYAFSCTGACPPGQPGPCLVFIDGQPTGAISINASQVPPGSQVTCDCDEPVEVCPLATDLCANFQFTDCQTNGINTLCWPKQLGSTSSGDPLVFTCDCFAEECGPVQVDPDPFGAGFIYSCPGPCPDPADPCEIFFDDGTGAVGTGANSVNSLNVPAGVIVTCDCGGGGEPDPVIIEWSMDIGGDTELSDPNADGDEGGDPGDVYLWRGAPYRPLGQPCGRDGFKDDGFIFGFDPAPSAPDCAVPPATAVPVGMMGNVQEQYRMYFDLDAHDQIDFNIGQFVPPTSPLEFPIPQGQITPTSACIYPPEFLLYSYDDDRRPGWPAGDVPVTAPSPAGNTYGSSGGIDEVLGKTLMPVLPLPFTVALDWRAWDEIGVHPDMAPNPNPNQGEEADDDVDSLDAVRDPQACPFWYFSADHEAHLGLDPGSIYLATGGGAPMQVIDDVIHLGLLETTDVDAFEFTWLEADIPGAPGGPALAVLFSVDEDDPLTPIDESGGLDPTQIYGSFLTGFSFPVIVDSQKPEDDVDALTIWVQELLPDCADHDVNCSGTTDVGDIGVVANPLNFQQSPPACDRADVNGSGTADIGDIGVIANPLNFQSSTGPCNCTTSTPGVAGCP